MDTNYPFSMRRYTTVYYDLIFGAEVLKTAPPYPLAVTTPFHSFFGLAGRLLLAASASTALAADYEFYAGPASGYAAPPAVVPPATINSSGTAGGTSQNAPVSPSFWRAINWSTSGDVTLNFGSFASTYTSMIGNSGATVGYGVNGTVNKPVRWESNGALSQLSTLAARPSDSAMDSKALAINSSGVTIGYSAIYDVDNTNLGTRATFWPAGSTAITTLPLADSNGDIGLAQAKVISESGLIAGEGQVYVAGAAKGTRGIRWTSNNTVATTLNTINTDINGPGGSGTVEVKTINNSGLIAGNARKYGVVDAIWQTTGLRAVRWDLGSSTPVELSPINTTSQGVNIDTTIIGMDRYGNIAGLSQIYEGDTARGTRPVVWKAGSTTPIQLQIYGTDVNNAGRGNMSAMNNAGFTAGTMGTYTSSHASIGRRAIVWDVNGVGYNLNDLTGPPAGWALTVATGISDGGWVTGYGTYDPDGAGGVAAVERYWRIYSPLFVAHPPASSSNLAISKIMYHPSAPSAAEITAGHTSPDAFEYIELINTSSTKIDLMALQVTGQISFNFTNSIVSRVLAPGARVLVASNKAAFDLRYGSGKHVAGSYTGTLSNTGGQIALLSYENNVVANVTYSSSNNWPAQAAGGGYSLVRRHPNGITAENNDPANWRASTSVNGAPGTSDSLSYSTWLTSNGATGNGPDTDGDGFFDFQEYAQSGSPTASDAGRNPKAGVAEFTVNSVTSNYVTITFSRRFAADDVTHVVQTNTSLNPLTWQDTGTVFVSATRESDGSETVAYRSSAPIGTANAGFLRVVMSLVP